MVDLTFVGQGNTSQVRRQPLCTDGFAYLGRHPSFAQCTKATFKDEMAQCQKYSCKLRWLLGPLCPRFSQGGRARVSKLAQTWSKIVLDSLFSAKTWCKVASHECLRSRIGKSLQSTLEIDPAVEDGLFFCVAKKAPHHTSYSVTHTWQTTKELSSPLGGPRNHNPNQFARPRWSSFVLGWYFMANGRKLDASHHALWCRCLGLEAGHFRSCNGKVKVPKRWSSTLCLFGPFWPSFYARGIWADLESGDRYALFCANDLGRRRYLFSTTHDAPLIFGGSSNSYRWPDSSLRVTTVCKGDFAN